MDSMKADGNILKSGMSPIHTDERKEPHILSASKFVVRAAHGGLEAFNGIKTMIKQIEPHVHIA